jgi:hypothetical protein
MQIARRTQHGTAKFQDLDVEHAGAFDKSLRVVCKDQREPCATTLIRALCLLGKMAPRRRNPGATLFLVIYES